MTARRPITFPEHWNASAHQSEVIASVGDDVDKVIFDSIIAKGMMLLDARDDGGVNGIKTSLRNMAGHYYDAAQAYSRLQHITREWEEYFPWVVFKNRYSGRRVDWIEWAIAQYGVTYPGNINDIIREWREVTQ